MRVQAFHLGKMHTNDQYIGLNVFMFDRQALKHTVCMMQAQMCQLGVLPGALYWQFDRV